MSNPNCDTIFIAKPAATPTLCEKNFSLMRHFGVMNFWSFCFTIGDRNLPERVTLKKHYMKTKGTETYWIIQQLTSRNEEMSEDPGNSIYWKKYWALVALRSNFFIFKILFTKKSSFFIFPIFFRSFFSVRQNFELQSFCQLSF